MANGAPAATDVRAWVPARDFDISKRFYLAMGWAEVFSNESMAMLELAGRRFVLQDYYVKNWAENSMMTVEVDDATAWFQHTSHVLNEGSFGDARVAKPASEDWCELVCYVWDPSGVLLHFVQFGA